MSERPRSYNKQQPYIGITCEVHKLSADLSEYDLLCDRRYVKAIAQAGGIPLLIPINEEAKALGRLLEVVAGLVIVGGADIHPEFYNERIKKKIKPVYHGRVHFEKDLYALAVKQQLPVLGICYGLQLINVIHGGTLYQDIRSEIKGAKNHQARRHPYHPVQVQQGTLCHKIFGRESFEVYSRHHQAIKVLGRDLTVSAFSPDGIVEAIEKPPYILGIQWHPEQQLDDRIQQRLFRHFVGLAKAH